MFPPSYQDRAILRGLKRQAIRQLKDQGAYSSDDVEKSKSVQTDTSYCYHKCKVHPDIAGPIGGKKGKEKGKGGKGEKGSDTQSKKDKGKSGKGKHVEFQDSEDSSSDDSDDSRPGKKAKGKSKGDGSKGEKGDKNKKSDKPGQFNDFLSYPWSSPNIGKIAGHSRFPSALGGDRVAPKGDKQDRKDQFSRSDGMIDQMVNSSRQSDEEYIARWLAQREALGQQGAVKWLGDRDVARFKRIQDLNNDLACMKLNINAEKQCCMPGCHCHGAHRRTTSYPGPGLPVPPSSPQPHGADPHARAQRYGAHNDAASDASSFAGHGRPKPRQPFVAAQYDENGILTLPDGTKVGLAGQPGLQSTPFLPTYRPPLQPMAPQPMPPQPMPPFGGPVPTANQGGYQGFPAPQPAAPPPWQPAHNPAPFNNAGPGHTFNPNNNNQQQQPHQLFNPPATQFTAAGGFNNPQNQGPPPQGPQHERKWGAENALEQESQNGWNNNNNQQQQWHNRANDRGPNRGFTAPAQMQSSGPAGPQWGGSDGAGQQHGAPEGWNDNGNGNGEWHNINNGNNQNNGYQNGIGNRNQNENDPNQWPSR